MPKIQEEVPILPIKRKSIIQLVLALQGLIRMSNRWIDYPKFKLEELTIIIHARLMLAQVCLLTLSTLISEEAKAEFNLELLCWTSAISMRSWNSKFSTRNKAYLKIILCKGSIMLEEESSKPLRKHMEKDWIKIMKITREDQFLEMALHQLKVKKEWELLKVVLIKNNFKVTSLLKPELKMSLAFCGHSLKLKLKDNRKEL